jgi:hypothetical protein
VKIAKLISAKFINQFGSNAQAGYSFSNLSSFAYNNLQPLRIVNFLSYGFFPEDLKAIFHGAFLKIINNPYISFPNHQTICRFFS